MSGLIHNIILLGLFTLPLLFILIEWKNSINKKKQAQRINGLLNILPPPPETKPEKSVKIKMNFNEVIYAALLTVTFILWSQHLSFYIIFIVDVLVIVLLKSVFQMLRDYRLAKLTDALPSTLDFLARNIKSGDSYITAIERVAQANFTASVAFKPIHDALRHGKPFAETLNKVALKINHPDFTLCMAVLIIQQETGKHDATHLNHLSEVLRKKIALRKKIKTNSAEARLGGYLLTFIPLICFILIRMLSPNYFAPLFQTNLGHYLLLYGLASNLVGLLVMKRMTQIAL